MSSPIGSALLGFWLTLSAGPAPLFWQDFRGEVPGDRPAHWLHRWGEQGDDLLLVSNCRARDGRALLLDRASGQNAEQWGCGRPLPNPTTPSARLELTLLVDGAAQSIGGGFEIRAADGARQVAAIGLTSLRVTLHDHQYKQAATVGELTADTWYRLTLWLPTQLAPTATATAQLSSLSADGTVTPLGPPQSVPCTAPPAYGWLHLNTYPGKRGYRLYVDELVWSSETVRN
ncbi:MAG: hypothetical protein IT204_24345 [Fimbriimonadaceae bacterium]|nr:hypothetical protein [Fimbriimonadaceae bacterium]